MPSPVSCFPTMTDYGSEVWPRRLLCDWARHRHRDWWPLLQPWVVRVAEIVCGSGFDGPSSSSFLLGLDLSLELCGLRDFDGGVLHRGFWEDDDDRRLLCLMCQPHACRHLSVMFSKLTPPLSDGSSSGFSIDFMWPDVAAQSWVSAPILWHGHPSEFPVSKSPPPSGGPPPHPACWCGHSSGPLASKLQPPFGGPSPLLPASGVLDAEIVSRPRMTTQGALWVPNLVVSLVVLLFCRGHAVAVFLRTSIYVMLCDRVSLMESLCSFGADLFPLEHSAFVCSFVSD
ncbi:hypothetical protein Dimus_029186 [Dionaea muscipula]